MSYRRFNLAELDQPPATVATVATVRAEDSSTVASVATVASREPKNSDGNHRTVASVATVASRHTETEPAQPISRAEFSAALEVAVERFMFVGGLGREQAEVAGWAMVRGHLLNDARLTPEQTDLFRCLVCGERESPGRALVPVLTPIEGRHLWLHSEPCHAEHLCRQRALAEALLDGAATPSGSAPERVLDFNKALTERQLHARYPWLLR